VARNEAEGWPPDSRNVGTIMPRINALVGDLKARLSIADPVDVDAFASAAASDRETKRLMIRGACPL